LEVIVNIFICPKCQIDLHKFFPEKCACGYEIPITDSIYQFCDDPPISLEKEGHKYLGYENVGENYDGTVSKSYENYDDDYGIFGACSVKLVEIMGKGCTILDLGAGLGPASITLAKAGANVIAADISQKMLSVAVKRTSGRQLEGDLIFTRMNGYNLQISDNSIDAVVAIDMLHQVDNPEAVFKEILRVLKPDGVFIQYGCIGLPIDDEQWKINLNCRETESDIRSYYNHY